MKTNFGKLVIDGTDSNALTPTASSQQYTIPVPGAMYMIKAVGASVTIKTGTNPTAVHLSHGYALSDGEVLGPFRIDDVKIAYISDAAGARYLYVVRCANI